MAIPLRVLIVEDSANDARLMLFELSRGEFAPDWKRVETADEMRAALAEGAWDVVLSDFCLPRFSAAEALDICRKADPDLPFIVVSGVINEERAAELMRAGASDFLMKDRLGRLGPAVEREVRETAGRRHRVQRIRLLEALVESADDSIMSRTLDGILTSWNPATERLYGWPAAEAIGQPHSLLIPPDKAAELTEVMDQLRAGDRVQTFETVRLHRDGTRIDVSLTVSPIKDPEGRLVGVSTTARDIRERKRSEDDLNRTTTLFRAVVDGTSDAVFIKDLAGRYILINEAASRFVGRPIEEVLGRDDTALFGPDDARQVMTHDRRVMDSDCISTHEESVTEAGVTRIYLSTKTPYKDARGRVIGLIGISRDLTDRLKGEVALRESQARLVRAQAVAKIGSWETDLTTLQVTWSDETYRIFEIRPDQGQMTHQRFLEFVHPEDRAGVDEAFIKSHGHRSLCSITHRAVTPDGRIKVLEECWQTQDNDRGEPVRVVGTCQDVTLRKQVDDAVRDSEARYRTLVEATAAIVWDSPPSGEFDSPQPRWTEFTGQTVDQHRGWGWLDVIHPDDREVSARAWAAAVAERGIYRVEHRLRRADGEYRSMSVRAVPVLDPDGAIREWVGVHTDVTEQKRANDAVRESEARNTAILGAALDGIVTIDREGRVLEFNPAAEAIFGYRSGDVVGREMAEFVIPARLRDAHRRGMAHYWATGDGPILRQRIELTALRADGTEFPVELAITPIPCGGSTVFTGFIRDITERKRAEAERAELLTRLNLQVERLPLAYLLSGPDFRYTRWNPAAERTFGFSQAEVLGKHPFEVIVPQEARDLVADIFARLAAGEMDAHGACENATKDGRVITCEWYNTPLFDTDGTFQGVLSLAQDVTERKRSEATLRDREELLRNIIAHIPAGVFWKDRDGRFLGANEQFALDQGFSASDEVVGKMDFDLTMTRAEADAFRAADLRMMVGGEPLVNVPETQTRSDGRKIHLLVSKVPLRDTTGQVSGVLGVYQDVTEARLLEEQFRQAQKMEAFGQLAGGVAHDFNNLLTIIIGYSEILLESLPENDPFREMIAEIHKAGERSAGLTRQLLAFSRQQVLATRILNLNEVVADTDKMLRRLIGEDIRLTTTLETQPWAVQADPGQVEQLLLNLAVNARDAMPKGGRLTIETKNVELDEAYIGTHKDVRIGRHVLLSVTDTGSGIPPAVVARIFEPFFTTKETGKGTGLGLATVYGIVKQSGGHVAVYSEVGLGTTFKVYLPQAEQPSERSLAPSRILAHPRGTETILLAEDEAAVRALTRSVLTGCGYCVLEAADGEEAVRVAAAHSGPIQLLITDVVMPGTGGRAVAEQLTKKYPSLRVIYVSGYTDDAVIRHGVLRDGVNFIQKPFTAAALARKVRDVLDGTKSTGDGR
jgi:two-component system cell cycle sensor histidine kinase/response regulator CckA